MEKFLIIAIGAVGITGIVLYSKILSGLLGNARKKYYLLRCPMCFGFWAGLLPSIYIYKDPVMVIYMAGVTSCLSYAFWVTFSDNGIQTTKGEKHDV